MLVDTDVLIWHLRGLPQATRRLDQLPNLTLCAITLAGVVAGFSQQGGDGRSAKTFPDTQAQHLPLTPAITDRAVALMESLTLSDGLQLGDALIAATALEHNLIPLTGNTKHFSPIKQPNIERFER